MSEFKDLMKPALFDLYHNQIRAENHNSTLLYNVWANRLNNGKNILQTEDEINTYLACYFGLHFCKLNHFFQKINFCSNENINLFDWGCGSATGALAFLNQFYGRINLNKIILIEPSKVAINRGKQYLDIFLDSEEIKPSIQLWNRTFKNLMVNKSDLIQTNSATNFHLFSNILDVEAVDISSLCDLILETQTGWNYFLCVSTTGGQAAVGAPTRIRQFYSRLCSYDLPVKMLINLENYEKIDTPPIYFLKDKNVKPRSINMFGGYFAIDFDIKNYINCIESYGVRVRDEIDLLENQIAEKNYELQQTKQVFDEESKKLVSANNKIKELQAQIEKLNVNVQEKNVELQKLNHTFHECNEKLLDKDYTISKLNKSIAEIDNDLRKKDDELKIIKQGFSAPDYPQPPTHC